MGRNSKYITGIVTLALSASLSLDGICADLGSLVDRVRRHGDLAALHEIAAQEPKAAISGLAPFAYQAVWGGDGDHPGVTAEAVRLLTQIPGHAEDRASRIEEARKLSDYNYDRERLKQFRFLGELRSEETIRVLGRYLTETNIQQQPIDPKHLDEWNYRPPNALLAVKALAKLRLPDAPTPKAPELTDLRDLPLWQAWWDKRQRSSNPNQTEQKFTGSMTSKTTSPRVVESGENPSNEQPAPTPWSVWGALIAVATGLLWLMLKKRK